MRDDQLEALAWKRYGRPSRVGTRRKRALPRALDRGLTLVNALRLKTAGPEWDDLRALDSECANALLAWWTARHEYRRPAPAPGRGLTLGQTVVIGAMVDLDGIAGHFDVAEACADLLAAARSGELASMVDAGLLALLSCLARPRRTTPDWTRRIRRCNFRRCCLFFVDRSQAMTALACSPAHAVRVHEQQGARRPRRKAQ